MLALAQVSKQLRLGTQGACNNSCLSLHTASAAAQDFARLLEVLPGRPQLRRAVPLQLPMSATFERNAGCLPGHTTNSSDLAAPLQAVASA